MARAKAASIRASIGSVLASWPLARAKSRARAGLIRAKRMSAAHSASRSLEVVDAGGLKDDQRIASPTRHQLCNGMWRVGDTFRHADAFIEDIEMTFGDVDSDAAKSYDHGACPCDARSVGAASCNCSG